MESGCAGSNSASVSGQSARSAPGSGPYVVSARKSSGRNRKHTAP